MPNDPSNALQAVEDAATELAAKTDGPPGVMVVVQRGNDRRVISAGVADLQTGARPRVDDYMRLASVSKAFNGATALSLVTRQVLSLEDTVGKWRPDLPREWASITLRQLLNHTSGIPNYTKEKAFTDALLASLLVAPSPVQLLSYIEKPKPSFTPGTKYAYSNSDNVIVGLMIEAATGSSYERALHSQVAAPFGLSHDPPQRRQTPAAVRARLPARRHGRARRRLRALCRRLGVGFGRRGFYTGRGKRVRAPLRRRSRDRFEDTHRAVPIHPGRQLGPARPR